jgi:hypothetical protein
MVDAVTRHADLLDETEVPNCLLTLVAHVAAYQAVIKGWEEGDYSQVTSLVEFPRESLQNYIEDSFRKLKQRQAKLLGESGRLFG